nr:MAG TPA: hypothetical protein [Microviridae sp.]
MPCYSPIRLRNPALESPDDKRRSARSKKLGTRSHALLQSYSFAESCA